MLMHQRGSDASPATDFFVSRFSQNLGQQNRIGALVTAKNNSDGHNIVSAVDGFFRLSESHQLNMMISHSANNSGTQGLAGSAQYFFISNQFKIWWTQSFVSKNYNPEAGFVSRSDVIATTPGIFYYYRGKKLPLPKLVRAFEPGIWFEMYHQASDGTLLERTASANPIWFNFQHGGYLGYIINQSFQRLTDVFSPLGVDIAAGDYSYINHQVYYSTDLSRKLSGGFDYTFGQYFNGRLTTGNYRLQISPTPHFSLTAQYNRNKFRDVGIAAAEKKVELVTLTGRMALNPRVQLTGFYQYNTDNNAGNYNVRFSWEYQPLSYIYLVFNHRGFDNTLLKRQTEDHSIFKISYLKQL